MRRDPFEAVIATLLIVASALMIALLMIYGGEAAAFQADSDANKPDFWCEPGMGVKHEPVDTPFIVPEPAKQPEPVKAPEPVKEPVKT